MATGIQYVAVGSMLSAWTDSKTILDCYCITLADPRCLPRKESFNSSARHYGWDFSFWYGIDATSPDFIARYPLAPSPRTEFIPTREEVACAMSHYLLIEYFLSGAGTYCLICEDDVVFTSQPPLLIPSHDFDILFLNSRSRHNHFNEFWGVSSCGTDTYLLTRPGARKLLRILNQEYLHLPFDMLIISQCVSMRRMGHHITRFHDPSLPSLTCLHDGPLTTISPDHQSLLFH